MTVYYLVSLVATILTAIAVKTSRAADPVVMRAPATSAPQQKPLPTSASRGTTPFDVAAVLVLVVFAGSRLFVGSDFPLYLHLYQELDFSGQLSSSPQEFGYNLLSSVVHQVSNYQYAIFWVTSIITIVPVYFRLRRESDDAVFALILYMFLAFYVTPFNIVRQGMAVSLNFLSYRYFQRNKVVFVLLNVVALSFHKSVIIALAIQLICVKWKPTVRQIAYFLIFSAFAGILFARIGLIERLIELVNPRYNTYTAADQAGLGIYGAIAAFLALLIYLLYITSGDPETPYLSFLVVGVGLLMLGISSVPAARMQLFFGIFNLLVLPNAMFRRRASSVTRASIIFATAIYFGLYISSFGNLVPYNSSIGLLAGGTHG